MEKIGKWLLYFAYGISPFISVLCFIVGIFYYSLCHSYSSISPLLIIHPGISFICIPQWIIFAFGVFVSKNLNEKQFSRRIRITTLLLFAMVLFLEFLLLQGTGFYWFWDVILPFLFCCFLPHVTFAVWNKTRPRKLPWIFTLIGSSAVSAGLLIVTYMDLALR